MPVVRWVELAEVTKPHGIRGEVRVKLYNSDSDLLAELDEVRVRDTAGKERMMTMTSVRGADEGHLLVKFEGVDSRDDAERLRSLILLVSRDEFPPLDEGEFYVCDIVGARLLGPQGEIGKVHTLVSYPTADALVVTLEGGKVGAAELPLIDEFIERVDAERGEVLVTVAALEFLSVSKSNAN